MEIGSISQDDKNKFEVLFNALSVGVVMLNRNFKVLEANAKMKQWFPNIADNISPCCFDVLHPENHGVTCRDCPVEKCFTDAQQHTIEQVKHTSQGRKYYKLVANPMFDNSGRVYAVMETLEDITVQKQYQIEHEMVSAISTLLVSADNETIREKIDAALMMAGKCFEMDRVYIFRVDPGWKQFSLYHEWCNEGIHPSFDSGPAEIAFDKYYWWFEQINHHQTIVIPDVENMPYVALAEKELFLGMNIKSIVGLPVFSGERMGGFMGYDSTADFKSLTDEQLSVMQVIAKIISDALEKDEAERALVKSEKEYRALASRYQAYIDASNAGAWEYHHKTGLLQCSFQYFGILGWGKTDFDFSEKLKAEQIWQKLIHPDDFAQAKGFLNYYLKQPEGIYEQIFRMLHQNGQYRFILSRGRLLKDEVGLDTEILIGTHIDITEQKKTEELILAKNKELESYLYVASHDLRAPLVNIQGFSNRIQKQIAQLDLLISNDASFLPNAEQVMPLLQEGVPKSLGFILSNVKKMDGLINGLLTISRTGRYKMNIELVDMKAMIEKIVHNFNFQIIENKVIIEQGHLPGCFGDAMLLSQLFSNLLENAIKYRNKDRQLVIQIEGHQNNDSIIFSVKDNGLGIDSVSIHKIWDVFYRFDPDYTLGDGIGLNLVAKIVEKHKGRVWVESKPGVGSIFYTQLSSVPFLE